MIDFGTAVFDCAIMIEAGLAGLRMTIEIEEAAIVCPADSCARGDLNADGFVDGADLAILLALSGARRRAMEVGLRFAGQGGGSRANPARRQCGP